EAVVGKELRRKAGEPERIAGAVRDPAKGDVRNAGVACDARHGGRFHVHRVRRERIGDEGARQESLAPEDRATARRAWERPAAERVVVAALTRPIPARTSTTRTPASLPTWHVRSPVAMVSVTWASARSGSSSAGNADMTVTYGGGMQAPKCRAQNGSAGGGRWRPRPPAARAGSAAAARRASTMSSRSFRLLAWFSTGRRSRAPSRSPAVRAAPS